MKTYNSILAKAIRKKFFVMKLIDEENYIIDYEKSTSKANQWFTKDHSGIPRKIENLVSVLIYILTLPLKIAGKGFYGVLTILIYIITFLLGISYLLGHTGFFWE
tara:strand:+ start:217 stop:531 length:315 start_codon:yes stop_codon:yes gene_type:complete